MEPDSVVNLVQSYKQIIPDWMLYNIIHQLILPKLKLSLENWPLKQWKFHTIIIPWIVLGVEMEQEIISKIILYYRKWRPDDSAGLELHQTWSQILSDAQMDKIVTSGVLPRLVDYLRNDFKLDPMNQDIGPLQIVFQWQPFIPPNLYSELFRTEFFNIWLDLLWNWLSAPSVILSEVAEWYEAWKQLFQPLDLAAAKEAFKTGLDMMNQGISASKPKSFIPTKEPKKSQTIETSQELTFKEYVQQMCEEANIEFVPLNRKTNDGNDMYRIGKLVSYLEDGVVWARIDGQWQFMSVDESIEKNLGLGE